MYPINVPDISRYATYFRCTPASFPMQYLGLPLHTHRLTAQEWTFLIDKIEKKLQNWKGSLLSIGGRLTLLHSVLSSVPLYFLSIYKIPDTIIQKIDRIRRRFLWQGNNNGKRKYSLISWQRACFAKEFGGLGILDLKQMNIALLMKWWWKSKDPLYRSAWKDMILHKYNTPSPHKSEFWANILKLQSLGQISVSYEPGFTTQVLFWSDIWYKNSPLSSRFSFLFNICTNPNIPLQTVINSQGGALQFRRSLDEVQYT